MLRQAQDQFPTRHLLVVGAVLLTLLSALIIATISFRSGPAGDPAPATAADLNQSGPEAPRATRSTPAELSPLPHTANPKRFARNVAVALFGWDTATLVGRDNHIEQLVKVGDPTGESTAGLLSDIDGYLPTADAWRDLAQYDTEQWLTIGSISTPTKWAEAEAQAGSALLPGTTALTIHGVRHRAGVWDGDPVSSQHDVAFTVFIVCGPSYPTCHLLRLSVLDKPLD